MARKPNYKFERMERQRAKDAKKAARLEASKERAKNKNPETAGVEPSDDAAGAPGELAPETTVRPRESGDPGR